MLLGHTVGNALGGPLEGYSSHRIRSLLSEGIRDIPSREKHRPWDGRTLQRLVDPQRRIAALPSPDTIRSLADRLWRAAQSER